MVFDGSEVEMSIHIGASESDVATTVLLPGDPMRAKFVADTYLGSVRQYNSVRGMLGYTGVWNERRVSVQGSGMGMPSLAIYVNELIRFYGVRRIIRIGSCGSFQPQINMRDLIFAMSASTDSAMNRERFSGMDYAPVASWSLLKRAVDIADARKTSYHIGGILSSDTFYQDDPDGWKRWARFGVLGVEMETNQLYTLAAMHGIEALTILTVSDSLVDGSELSSDDRERSFGDMIEIALGIV